MRILTNCSSHAHRLRRYSALQSYGITALESWRFLFCCPLPIPVSTLWIISSTCISHTSFFPAIGGWWIYCLATYDGIRGFPRDIVVSVTVFRALTAVLNVLCSGASYMSYQTCTYALSIRSPHCVPSLPPQQACDR